MWLSSIIIIIIIYNNSSSTIIIINKIDNIWYILLYWGEYKNRYDSFNTVGRLKTFIWRDKKPLNYDLLKAPNSQDLPDNYNYLTFGINIIDRKKMIKFKNIVGKNPMFMILDKFESIDINDKIDFTMAQSIYKKNFKGTFLYY